MKQKLLKAVVFVTAILVISAYQGVVADNTAVFSFSNAYIVSSPSASPMIDSPIRKIDFKNFSYPDPGDYMEFILKNGEKPFVRNKEDGLILENIGYFDVTNDGAEEAIVRISVLTGGSAIPNLIYIYTLQYNKPKLLWSFITGDRADGGFKNISAENGKLIIELFGNSKYVNDEWKFEYPPEKYQGAGRPTIYTKSRFKWNGKKFIVEGQPELYNYNSKEENKNEF